MNCAWDNLELQHQGNACRRGWGANLQPASHWRAISLKKIGCQGDETRRVVVARIPEWDGLRRSGPSAILRDLGRFGLVVVNEAVIDGKGVVPKNWFDDRRQARGVRIFVVATFPGLTRFTRVLSKRGGSLGN